MLAGIAAADAACCAALGKRSRSQNHRDAAALVASVRPGGSDAAKRFERLIALKDEAQYGFGEISGPKLASAQRQANALVTFAEAALAR